MSDQESDDEPGGPNWELLSAELGADALAALQAHLTDGAPPAPRDTSTGSLGAGAALGDSVPASNAIYKEREYWDARFETEEAYDWLVEADEGGESPLLDALTALSAPELHGPTAEIARCAVDATLYALDASAFVVLRHQIIDLRTSWLAQHRSSRLLHVLPSAPRGLLVGQRWSRGWTLRCGARSSLLSCLRTQSTIWLSSVFVMLLVPIVDLVRRTRRCRRRLCWRGLLFGRR